MHPIIFAVGSAVIRSYSLMNLLAIAAASLVILWLAKKDGLDEAKMATFLFFLSLVTLLGARFYLLLYYLLKEPSYLFQDTGRIFDLLASGGAFYGGLIAGILFSIWYLGKAKISFWRASDITGVGLALGQSIGRIACFLAGCCYGKPTHFFLAVKFPHLLNPVHPTQLYESILDLGNFFLLLQIFKKRRFPGQVLAFYMINYSIIRFFLEYLRGDTQKAYLFVSHSPLLSLSLAQAVSLLGFIAGIIIYRMRRKERPIQTPDFSMDLVS